MRTLRDVSLVVLTLGSAVGASQVPRFIQEYEQRLGGAVQEVRRQLGAYDAEARKEGKPLAEWSKLLAAEGGRSATLGHLVEDQIGRDRRLSEHARALEQAGPYAKPLVMLHGYEPDILAATWAKYAYTLTLDVGFAAAGALLGLLANAALWSMPSRLIGRRRASSTI